ncbi:sialate O-acetylesterase [uncultured Chitinophaga sp.]|uniref:sialate O-acetylesterase n=1 Tax=uncultured Chitinophaga sp. TaxID=339340 RepID=UPI0025D41ECB|nr:sialate O-acetylesterase [uncultured Chitinophaga sp.]
MKKILSFLLLMAVFGAARAEIRLPAIISSKMVLQQNATVKLWGWALPGERVKVTCSWNNSVDSVTTTPNANWFIEIKTPAAGGPYTITLQGWNTIKLDDVLIGEVWLCSGQSNMEYSGNNNLPDIKAELPKAANPKIRFFHIPKTTSTTPQDDVNARWVECDAKSLQSFSAVGYFFGKTLHRELNAPVGLINASWGGTPAETWTPESAVKTDSILSRAAGKLGVSQYWPRDPGYTYNGMIAPLRNFNIAGAIWYQGESNVGTNSSYTKLFSAMINKWREEWKKNFAFYFVQIAPFNYGTDNINGSLLREAQFNTLAVTPNTGMAVVTDLVHNVKDIHPINKHDVGYRLAGLALAKTYNKPVASLPYQYPVYEKMEVVKGKVVVTFKDVPGGLVIKGDTLKEFFVAGADKNFVQATGKVKGNTITLSSPVKEPVAVRFGFTNMGEGNLFSKEGLPATPFRTDNW